LVYLPPSPVIFMAVVPATQQPMKRLPVIAPMKTALFGAKAQNVSFHGFVADLNTYRYPENYYDFIFLSLFFSADLMPKIKKSLKSGGYIMLYNRLDTGKRTQKLSPDDFLVKPQDLKTSLKDFQIKVFKEYKDHDVDVVGVLARKP
jgi:hypothetical protein